jgi:hypothetical protein
MGVARPKGQDDPWPTMVRHRAWLERGQRRLAGAHGGLGRRCKLKGVSGRAPNKVSGGGAHPSGVSVVRGWSSGGRVHSSMPNVEVMAGGDPDEVLQLGEGGMRSLCTSQLKKKNVRVEMGWQWLLSNFW